MGPELNCETAATCRVFHPKNSMCSDRLYPFGMRAIRCVGERRRALRDALHMAVEDPPQQPVLRVERMDAPVTRMSRRLFITFWGASTHLRGRPIEIRLEHDNDIKRCTAWTVKPNITHDVRRVVLSCRMNYLEHVWSIQHFVDYSIPFLPCGVSCVECFLCVFHPRRALRAAEGITPARTPELVSTAGGADLPKAAGGGAWRSEPRLTLVTHRACGRHNWVEALGELERSTTSQPRF